ncbi:MAG: hypothetical protein K9W42_05185 [Candidatus Heimdallarchaeota archaeon]|nr:hypothetical protein [Candidatus Heimdallarchaeota archaeon]
MNYARKQLDLERAFKKLEEQIQAFITSQTMEKMERAEIERLIQQINRLIDKLVKLEKIYS